MSRLRELYPSFQRKRVKGVDRLIKEIDKIIWDELPLYGVKAMLGGNFDRLCYDPDMCGDVEFPDYIDVVGSYIRRLFARRCILHIYPRQQMRAPFPAKSPRTLRSSPFSTRTQTT